MSNRRGNQNGHPQYGQAQHGGEHTFDIEELPPFYNDTRYQYPTDAVNDLTQYFGNSSLDDPPHQYQTASLASYGTSQSQSLYPAQDAGSDGYQGSSQPIGTSYPYESSQPTTSYTSQAPDQYYDQDQESGSYEYTHQQTASYSPPSPSQVSGEQQYPYPAQRTDTSYVLNIPDPSQATEPGAEGYDVFDEAYYPSQLASSTEPQGDAYSYQVAENLVEEGEGSNPSGRSQRDKKPRRKSGASRSTQDPKSSGRRPGDKDRDKDPRGSGQRETTR